MPMSRRALRTVGFGSLALAGGFGLAALRHMSEVAAYGDICGGAISHCAACPAAAGAALLGISALLLAAQAPSARMRVGGR
ncbi:hypothetical protein LJR219_004007 [Phenylobacterium sp. LjRoot219]|uniref:hypothetical protein n=1 Tax=Phenylobacterium sp. LjRoot219 TaxID=3342283 RepID=UPI003ECDEEEC